MRTVMSGMWPTVTTGEMAHNEEGETVVPALGWE